MSSRWCGCLGGDPDRFAPSRSAAPPPCRAVDDVADVQRAPVAGRAAQSRATIDSSAWPASRPARASPRPAPSCACAPADSRWSSACWAISRRTSGVLQRAPHDRRVVHAPPVVGEHPHPRPGAAMAPSRRAARPRAHGDRADGVDVGQPDPRRGAEHELDPPRCRRRLGVGHAARGVAPDRGRRPPGDRLLVLVARLTEVGVEVDQAGR